MKNESTSSLEKIRHQHRVYDNNAGHTNQSSRAEHYLTGKLDRPGFHAMPDILFCWDDI